MSQRTTSSPQPPGRWARHALARSPAPHAHRSAFLLACAAVGHARGSPACPRLQLSALHGGGVQVGRHSPDHAKAVSDCGALPKLVACLASSGSSEDLRTKAQRALKAIINMLTDLKALDRLIQARRCHFPNPCPALSHLRAGRWARLPHPRRMRPVRRLRQQRVVRSELRPCALSQTPELMEAVAKYVVAQIAKVLPNDPASRHDFVTSGGFATVQASGLSASTFRSREPALPCRLRPARADGPHRRSSTPVWRHSCEAVRECQLRIPAPHRAPTIPAAPDAVWRAARQALDAASGSAFREHVEVINSCFPPEIVKYYSPGYSKQLLEKLEAPAVAAN